MTITAEIDPALPFRRLINSFRCTRDGFPRLLQYLIDTSKNKSAAIRRRCLDYVMLALARWSDASFDRYAHQIRCMCLLVPFHRRRCCYRRCCYRRCRCCCRCFCVCLRSLWCLFSPMASSSQGRKKECLLPPGRKDRRTVTGPVVLFFFSLWAGT